MELNVAAAKENNFRTRRAMMLSYIDLSIYLEMPFITKSVKDYPQFGQAYTGFIFYYLSEAKGIYLMMSFVCVFLCLSVCMMP